MFVNPANKRTIHVDHEHSPFLSCESDELHSSGLFKSHERTTPGEYGSAQERYKEF